MGAEKEMDKKNVQSGEVETYGIDMSHPSGGESEEIGAAFDGLAALDPALAKLLASISVDQKTLAGRVESVKRFVREGGFKNTERALKEDEVLFDKVYMILGSEFMDGQRVKFRELCKTMEDIFKIMYGSFPVIVSQQDVIGAYILGEDGEVSDKRFLEVRRLAVFRLAQVRSENPGVDIGNDDDRKVWGLLEEAEKRVKRDIEEIHRGPVRSPRREPGERAG